MIGRSLNIGSPVNRSAALNRGLVSWYLSAPAPYFGGPRFLDLMGVNHGILTGGPVWNGARGRLGGYGSLEFDKVDDYVDLGTGLVDTLNGTAFTIALSFYKRSEAVKNVMFGRNLTNRARQMAADWQTGSKLTVGEENIAFIATSATTIALNTWYRAMWTYSAGANVLYLNGISDATASYTFGGSFASDYLLGNSDNATLDGFEDDVKVWNRALSAGEAWQEFQESRTGNPTTLNWFNRVRVAEAAGGAATPRHLALLGVGA